MSADAMPETYHASNWSFGDFNPSPRFLLDNHILSHFHPEGNCLWIGWKKYCIEKDYLKKLQRTATHVDLLDKNPGRLDPSIYNEQTVDIIADICNMRGIVVDETYDTIINNGVLEYVDSIPDAISECARILKRHGRILFGLPGKTWTATGHNRPEYDFMIEKIRAAGLMIIEAWREPSDKYYYFHCWKG